MFFYSISSLRRRAPLALLFALLLVVAPGLARAQVVAALPSPWIVVESSGPAEVRHDRGSWLPLVAGLAVTAPSEIRTGPAAEVLLKRGDDRVHLKGQSYLELPPAAPNGAPGDGTMTRLVQWLGEAFFEVGRRPNAHFEVDTPYLAAIVKGTAFTVEVTHDDSAVAVSEGVVAVVTRGGASTDVRAGMVARGYAGLSGLTIEDNAAVGGSASGAEAPSSDSDHVWPTPDFQPISPSFPQL